MIAAEIAGAAPSSLAVQTLQWSRGVIAAEMHEPVRLWPNLQGLQWSRGVIAAEMGPTTSFTGARPGGFNGAAA